MTETSEYAKMMRRMVRGFAKRVAEGDPADFAEMVATAQAMDEALAHAVTAMRENHGFSWAQIAHELGMTRQGAQQRFGRRTGNAETPLGA